MEMLVVKCNVLCILLVIVFIDSSGQDFTEHIKVELAGEGGCIDFVHAFVLF